MQTASWSSTKSISARHFFCCLSEQSWFSLWLWKHSNKIFLKIVRPSGVQHWKVPSESLHSIPHSHKYFKNRRPMRSLQTLFWVCPRKYLISSIQGFKMVHCESTLHFRYKSIPLSPLRTQGSALQDCCINFSYVRWKL